MTNSIRRAPRPWWPGALCLGLLAGCDRSGPGPTDRSPAEVVHLVDRWQDFTALEGDVCRITPVQRVALTDLAPQPYGGGLSLVELPCRALEETLAVKKSGDGDPELERRAESFEVSRDGGFTCIPARRRIYAFDVKRVQGKKLNTIFAGQARRPRQLLLAADGDHLAEMVEIAYRHSTLRILARAGVDGEVPLQVLVNGQKAGAVAVRGTEWQVYEMELRTQPRRHELRIAAAPGRPLPEKAEYFASILWFEVLHPASDALLLRSEDCEALEVSYLALNPEVDEFLRVDPESSPTVHFLSVGGDAVLGTPGPLDSVSAEGITFSRAELAGGTAVLKDLAPGLHSLTLAGSPAELRIHQPLARLTPQLINQDLRLRDHPHEDGVRTGGAVPSEMVDRVLSRMELREDRQVAFWLPTRSSLELRVKLASGDRLRYAAGIPDTPPQGIEEADVDAKEALEQAAREDLHASFRITWQPAGGAPAVLDTVERALVHAPWLEREVTIPGELAGEGTLRFETWSESGARGVPAAFADPRIVPAQVDRKGRPNVLLYVVDTLRADHLSSYGNENETTPFLDSLAAQGFRFERAYSVASWTRPSTASVLTGLYPSYHQAIGGNSLPFSLVTLAEAFRTGGYSCWALAANVQVSARGLHFEQGFHRFFSHDGLVEGDASSDRVNDTLFPLLARSGDEPLFVYLHSLDPHSPYMPPRQFRAPFGRDYDGRLKKVPMNPRVTLRPLSSELTEEDIQYVRDVYDNEIRYQDMQFERLFDELEERGILDDTLVFITSDHGEEFMEHGDWDHTGRAWEELVRVPGILWIPERWRAEWNLTPRVIEEPISLVDIPTSLLDLAGVPDPSPRQGRSFRELLAGESDEPWILYSEEAFPSDRDNLGSLRSGDYKLIWKRDRETDAMSFQLFHLKDDPGEQHDLAAAKPDVVEALKRLRDKVRADADQIQERFEAVGLPPLPRGERVQLDAGAEEELRALGYMEDGGG